jgi:predicted RNA-binding protein YlxR (DUF448 family)
MPAQASARSHDHELDSGPHKGAPGAERFCAVTGTVKPAAAMIRFVLGPDGVPVPDLKRRLPGRGVWITATRDALAQAVKRKVFARAFKREVGAAGDLVAATERLLERAALDALAIAHKAGRVAIGFTRAEAALAGGRVVALIEAADAAPDGVRKLAAAARRNAGPSTELPAIAAFTSAQLDLALGRSNVVHAALLGGPESEALLARLKRLDHFRSDAADDRHSNDRTERPAEWDRNA